MSFPNRDAQILAHILEYCNRIEKTLSRFGREFDVFLEDQDYMDSVSMNLLQIGELAGKFSDAYVQKTKPQMDWRAIKNMRNMFAHDYGSMDKDRICRRQQKTFRRSRRIVNAHWPRTFNQICNRRRYKASAACFIECPDCNPVPAHGHPAYDPSPAASA